MEFEEVFKISIKRRTANKDKDCQAEAILTSLLRYSVLADLSQFNVITNSGERWRCKIERIYSHWALNHFDERTRLEHLFRSCTAPASSDEEAEKGVTTAHREPSGNL